MEREHMAVGPRLILLVLACLLFGLAAFGWPAPVEPYRTKIIAAGLFCWTLSLFF